MEPSPYIPEAERTRRILIERYMRLKHNYVYDSGCEKYPWLDDSAKLIRRLPSKPKFADSTPAQVGGFS
ncbi:hypothetical protein TNCV_1830991 [Trichonephila clavipes]|nr:hypothetical protein TNCV_1830991 [Trichonephila clavipes]